MTKTKPYDIAISFSREEGWIAKDIYHLLKQSGVSVYCYLEYPDKVKSDIEKNIKKIYQESLINVVIASDAYDNAKRKTIVDIERNLLRNRHSNDKDSLFILNICDRDSYHFHGIRNTRIKEHGVICATEMIISRLISKWHAADFYIFNTHTAPHHPAGVETQRGYIEPPHEFKVAENFKNDLHRRWDKLGDLLVELDRKRNEPLLTYLIPSGRVPPYLSHTTLLKTRPELLALKKTLAIDFVIKNQDKQLQGMVFKISKDGAYYPHLYCREFDDYLIDNHTRYCLTT